MKRAKISSSGTESRKSNNSLKIFCNMVGHDIVQTELILQNCLQEEFLFINLGQQHFTFPGFSYLDGWKGDRNHTAHCRCNSYFTLKCISSFWTNISAIIEVQRHSWTSPIPVIAFILRFRGTCKYKDDSLTIKEHLTAAELQRAEFLWIGSIQTANFSFEISYLTKKIGARPSFVSQLDSYLETDGFYCCKLRLENSQ